MATPRRGSRVNDEDRTRFAKSRAQIIYGADGRAQRRIHISAHTPWPIEASSEDRRAVSMAGKYAAMTNMRLCALVKAAQYVCRYKIAGPAVVCGAGQGGSALALARAFRNAGDTEREIWLYDTFDGAERNEGDDYYSSIAYIKTILAKRCPQYRQESFIFVQGLVENTIPGRVPEGAISILHCDTDWYESTKHELNHLYPRLARGGVILIDDYGVWDGARKATDEYFAERDDPILLLAVDHTGRMGVKTGV